MIVFDASTLVGAALKADSVPERALLYADEFDLFALSGPVEAEVVEVLGRAKFARSISAQRRALILALLRTTAVWFDPIARVTDCRDPGDNKYLELALASGAERIVSSDRDLLVLHPWRDIQILRPSACLALF